MYHRCPHCLSWRVQHYPARAETMWEPAEASVCVCNACGLDFEPEEADPGDAADFYYEAQRDREVAEEKG